MYGFAHLSRIWANIRLAGAIYEKWARDWREQSCLYAVYNMGLMLKEYIQSSMGLRDIFPTWRTSKKRKRHDDRKVPRREK